MTKIWVGIGVLILVIIAAVWLIKTPAPSDLAADRGINEKNSVAWRFDSAGESATTTGAQLTKVTLVWNGRDYDAGTYLGSCFELRGTPPFEHMLENEVAGVLCWYAGGGDEIGVFKEGAGFVIKRGEQSEPAADFDGFRGNFKTIATLE